VYVYVYVYVYVLRLRLHICLRLHFERNSPHISLFAHAQLQTLPIPERINEQYFSLRDIVHLYAAFPVVNQ